MLLTILLVVEVLISLALIGVVLLQRSEGGALGMGGGPSGFMTARGAGDLLTRTTWILGSLFFVVALLLTVLSGRERGASSVVDRLKVDAMDPSSLARPQPQPSSPTAPAPAPGGQAAPLGALAPASANPFAAPAPAQQQPAQP